MKRDFVFKGIVLPLAAALAVCIAFVLFFNLQGERLLPFHSGARFSYFDSLNYSDQIADVNSDELKSNDLIGVISCNDELGLRYDADYSALINCASLSAQSADFDETGCAYIELTSNNVSKLISEQPVSISTSDGEYTYKFDKEMLVKSEREVFSIAPSYKHSLVIYYRVSKGIGLTTDYYALLYKGVK